jgi:hypothetical protein
VPDKRDEPKSWPTPEQYGQRFAVIDRRLAQRFLLAEYKGDSEEDVAILRYRLAKLYMAGEDIQAAIAMLANEEAGDKEMARAIVELRNACGEVIDSFSDVNDRLVKLLNFASE